MADCDHFDLFILDAVAPRPSDLVMYENDEAVGVMHAAQEDDDSLSAAVLLENLACKATGVLALERLLAQVDVFPSEIEFAIGCGEEAVGDRYQRGGGNLAKAIAEQAGCTACSGQDVKAFCAAPMHAMLVASSLVAAGVFRSVVVVAGGSLAKLGMKFAGSAKTGGPILEDTLAGLAFLIGPSGNGAPVVRLESLGRHRVSSGSAQQAVLADLVTKPLDTLGMKMTEVGRFATELHDPDITEPAGAGNVPSRNYRMLAAMAVLQGQLAQDDLERFEHERGMPGFSPTQGHVASAIPWLPHGLARLRSGEIENTMLLAKGSLFLGRMTEMADGLSLLLEPER
jgi:betaine reductase